MIQHKTKRGDIILLNEADADLADSKWFVTANGYVVGHCRGAMVYMHRIILERMLGRKLQKGEDTDHINRIRTDNQRENLRVASRSENLANKEPHRKAQSGILGVYLNRGSRKHPWRAEVTGIHLGLYATPEEAGRARNEYIKQHGLDFVRLSNV